jgi:hypothetical protein
MPPKVTVNKPPIQTRVQNKTTHPGNVDVTPKPPKRKRRTKAEVQAEKMAKVEAKKILSEARKKGINRTAEFEHDDIANEDIVDATPRPMFTPRPPPGSRNQKNSPLTPFADTSDNISVDGDSFVDDETPLMPGSNSLVHADDSAVESDGPPPAEKKVTAERVNAKKLGEVDHKRRVVNVESDIPLDSDEDQPQEPKPKRMKTKTRDEINAATTNDGPPPAEKKVTAARVNVKKLGEVDRKRRVVDVESDIPLDSDEDQPQEPKPKKMKTKTRDEINAATTKIEKEKEGNKYAKMVNSMGSSGKPASNVPSHSSQSQAVGGRQLKREGAIADIKKLGSVGGKKLKREGAIADITTLTFPDSSTRAEPDDNIR